MMVSWMYRPEYLLAVLLAALLSACPNSVLASDAKARAYYFAAEEAYDAKKYGDALSAIAQSERELNGSNSRLSALKVKVYFGQRNYNKARAELENFYTMKYSASLGREMSSYQLKVDKELDRIRAKQAEERKQELERQNQAELAANFSLSKEFVIGKTEYGSIYGLHQLNNEIFLVETPGSIGRRTGTLASTSCAVIGKVELPDNSFMLPAARVSGNSFLGKHIYPEVRQGGSYKTLRLDYGLDKYTVNPFSGISTKKTLSKYSADKDRESIGQFSSILPTPDSGVIAFSEGYSVRYTDGRKIRTKTGVYATKFDSSGYQGYQKRIGSESPERWLAIDQLGVLAVYQEPDHRKKAPVTVKALNQNAQITWSISLPKDIVYVSDAKRVNSRILYSLRKTDNTLAWATSSLNGKEFKVLDRVSKPPQSYADRMNSYTRNIASNKNRSESYIVRNKEIIKLNASFEEQWRYKIPASNGQAGKGLLTEDGELILAVSRKKGEERAQIFLTSLRDSKQTSSDGSREFCHRSSTSTSKKPNTRSASSNNHSESTDFVPLSYAGAETKRYSSGDIYFGTFKNGKRHGNGKYTWANGNVYEGDFILGKRTGKGRFVWVNGDVYEGDFIDSKRTGKGTYTWSNRDEYEGDFIAGKRTGNGKFVWVNGDVYEGDFIDSKRTGKGTFTWPNGDVYVGDYVDGKRHGKGKYTWPNGRVYVGDWLNGQQTGKGTFTWPNGDVYVGDFLNDKRTGKGTFTWPNGDVYVGDYVDGKRHGKGKYTWPNGRVYVGDWLNGQQTGKGTFTWPNGDVYVGDFLNDKRTGKGRITWSDGDVYEGDFVDGQIVQ